eukprot:364498-Chlamydomonas_euryale.AAC.5
MARSAPALMQGHRPFVREERLRLRPALAVQLHDAGGELARLAARASKLEGELRAADETPEPAKRTQPAALERVRASEVEGKLGAPRQGERAHRLRRRRFVDEQMAVVAGSMQRGLGFRCKGGRRGKNTL